MSRVTRPSPQPSPRWRGAREWMGVEVSKFRCYGSKFSAPLRLCGRKYQSQNLLIPLRR